MKKVIVEHLNKKSGQLAVIDDVTFSINKGEIFALTGIAGSGKTLVTKLIEKLALKASGNVAYDCSNTGMIISDQNFYKDKTLVKTLKYFAKLKKKQVSNTEILNILNLAGLKKFKNITVSRLSNNQKARLKFAIALIAKPSVLILDEPFTNLCMKESRALKIMLKTLADKFGVAILITANDLSTVEEICDTIAIIDDGMIVVIKSYNSFVRDSEPFSKISITTPTPNFAAQIIEEVLYYPAHLCGPDVIVDAPPEYARKIYDELCNHNITVFKMEKVNKSIQEQYFELIQRRRGAV